MMMDLLEGPTYPVTRELYLKEKTLDAGDNVILTPPKGRKLRIKKLTIVNTDTTNNATILFKDVETKYDGSIVTINVAGQWTIAPGETIELTSEDVGHMFTQLIINSNLANVVKVYGTIEVY